MKKSYKVLSKKELSRVLGGWGYSLTFIDRRWKKGILKWFRG